MENRKSKILADATPHPPYIFKSLLPKHSAVMLRLLCHKSQRVQGQEIGKRFCLFLSRSHRDDVNDTLGDGDDDDDDKQHRRITCPLQVNSHVAVGAKIIERVAGNPPVGR